MTNIAYQLTNLYLKLINLTKKKGHFTKKDEKKQPFIKSKCKKGYLLQIFKMIFGIPTKLSLGF